MKHLGILKVCFSTMIMATCSIQGMEIPHKSMNPGGSLGNVGGPLDPIDPHVTAEGRRPTLQDWYDFLNPTHRPGFETLLDPVGARPSPKGWKGGKGRGKGIRDPRPNGISLRPNLDLSRSFA